MVSGIPGASTTNPVRPSGYGGGDVSSCSNSNYVSGDDVKNMTFRYATPGTPYTPGLGRNSFVGPCYTNTDLSFGLEQRFSVMRVSLFRQAGHLSLQMVGGGSGSFPAATFVVLAIASNPAKLSLISWRVALLELTG